MSNSIISTDRYSSVPRAATTIYMCQRFRSSAFRWLDDLRDALRSCMCTAKLLWHWWCKAACAFSRWRKAEELMRDSPFAALPHVKLSGSERSCYWRYHTDRVGEDGA